MSALNPRAIAARGVGFEPRVRAALGLWPLADSGFNGGGARSKPRRTREARDRERLDELMRRLEQVLDAAPSAVVPGATASPITFRTDNEAAARVAEALRRIESPAPLADGDEAAMGAILRAAKMRAAVGAETDVRVRNNRWRAIVLVALLMLS
jgi:hypothetical protein